MSYRDEEKEYLESKKAFVKDCRQDKLFPIAENTIEHEVSNDTLYDIPIVQQHNKIRSTEKQPVFH